MDKASRAIRRSGAKLKSLGSGESSDLNVMISELKDMRESAKGFMNSQNSACQDMMRWAVNEENRAIQDVANHITELNLLWTDVQKDFIGHLKEYKQMFEMVLEGEKQVSQAKENLSNCEQKESKLRKDLTKAEKRNCEADRRNLETKLYEAKSEREKAEIEVTERIRENEAVKMIRLKEGFVRIAEAYIELGKKCSTVFKAQKDVAMEIPDVHGKELEEVKYTGSSKTQNHLYKAKEKLHKYRRESFRLNPPPSFPAYHCKTPDVEEDDPPPYTPLKQQTPYMEDKTSSREGYEEMFQDQTVTEGMWLQFVGINASDINVTAGRYGSQANIKPPFDIGFEGLGEVVEAGKGSPLPVGQAVMYFNHGAFTDYKVLKAKRVFPIPSPSPQFLPFLVSGITASIALDKVGDVKRGETVLVTAAAGGTGMLAVQWAKLAGCHVIGTCSTDAKVEFLKKIGCDRPINYKKESLKEVLKSEYKNGIDVIYESIGGEIFDTCVNSLALKGRLIVIGFIEGYQSDLGFKPSRTMATIPVKLLNKSASIRGFFLEHFMSDIPSYISKMIKLQQEGKLQSFVDLGENTEKGPFKGLESVADAVEYLYTQKSIGKIIVSLNGGSTSKL
ncbi:uncharacterized protein LOC134249152 [Saccostrea cucullata]|uniref:uncharacterized protein LOC134249152 n=1 Tax=Saccostrea cuccullata TaxID=36930 RepID=UPI002ED39117